MRPQLIARRLLAAAFGLVLLVGSASSGGVRSADAQEECEYPGVLLVLDRSTSMRREIQGGRMWDLATEAIGVMLAGYSDGAHFGLMVYPGPSGTGANGVEGDVPACFGGVDCTPTAPQCTTGEVVVDIGADTSAAIDAALVFPDEIHDSYTPTWQSLEAADDYAPLHNPFRRNFVVLITDGWQCCGVYSTVDDDGNRTQHCTDYGSERALAAEKVAELAAHGIKTFVIGFGGSVDTGSLNNMAIEGGTALAGCDPNAGLPCYYQADDHAQLESFLEGIARQISEEICDGLDNDCNGASDDGLSQECETACGVGEEVCVGGLWIECDAPTPEGESCDGVDNDCDGDTDEDLAGAPADLTEGVCQGSSKRCDGARGWVEPDYFQIDGYEADETSCDGLDNDCDGDVDEGCECEEGDQRECGTDVGECVAGTQTCTNGQWGACEGGQGSVPELCDGKDNDCDGTVDSMEQDCSTACGDGTEVCLNGSWVGCDAPLPSMERCNGEDDDCDGRVDEELTQPCNNGCEGEDGVQICSEGQWGECDARTPTDEEICGDGIDNDCNNAIDDGCVCEEGDTQVCGNSLGACEQGEQTCEQGEWSICRGGIMATEEVCDGDDNDCDGQTDENADQVCSNDCGEGVRRCEDGELGICSVPDPPAEVCDGLDNDCDELVDEGPLCPPDTRCFCGGCVGRCMQGECEDGAQCIDGFCIVDQCPEGSHCDGTSCVPGEGDTEPGEGEGEGEGDGDDGDGGGGGGGDTDSPADDSCGCRALSAPQAARRGGPFLLTLLGLFFLVRRRG